jgi:exodeoxyribonuclease VII small subunit
VVERLESGDLTLEESLECFEQGVKSAARCRKLLKEVELKVELLLKDRDGGLTLEDFNQQ